MTWITYAQQQAEDNKNKKKIEEEQAINNVQAIREQKIQEFNRITLQTVFEIEKILKSAKEQGLEITNKKAGEVEDGSGNFMEKVVGAGDSIFYPAPGQRYAYNIYWRIRETAINSSMKISLGIHTSKSQNNTSDTKTRCVLAIKTDCFQTPKEITTPELEQEIKKWLLEIYSK